MNIGIRIITTLLTLSLGLAYAAPKEDHSQHGGMPPAKPEKPCTGPNALPSLGCVTTISSHFDQNGRLWLAWSSGGHVYINHSDDLGNSTSQPVAVNRIPEPISAKNENRPKVATDAKGNVFVSWTRPLEKRFTGHIRFSRSTDGGEHFSEPVTVNDDPSITGHRFDAMGVNTRGDIYVAWLDKRDRDRIRSAGNDYNGAALYYALSTDGGASFLPNQKIVDHTCECCRVVMDFDSNQQPVIMWRHIYGDHIRDHGIVSFTDPTSPGTPVRVSEDGWRIEACPHHGPALSIAEDDIYHITWFTNAPGHKGLHYARSLDQGQTFPNPWTFGNYNRGASHAHVLTQGSQVFITWKEFDGENSHLMLIHSKDKGENWSETEELLSSPGDSDYPFLLNHGNKIYISWHRTGTPFALIPVRTTAD
jgi:hypothetical protein